MEILTLMGEISSTARESNGNTLLEWDGLAFDKTYMFRFHMKERTPEMGFQIYFVLVPILRHSFRIIFLMATGSNLSSLLNKPISSMTQIKQRTIIKESLTNNNVAALSRIDALSEYQQLLIHLPGGFYATCSVFSIL